MGQGHLNQELGQIRLVVIRLERLKARAQLVFELNFSDGTDATEGSVHLYVDSDALHGAFWLALLVEGGGDQRHLSELLKDVVVDVGIAGSVAEFEVYPAVGFNHHANLQRRFKGVTTQIGGQLYGGHLNRGFTQLGRGRR